MNAKISLLNSADVLLAIKGHDENEVCYLADKTWLDNSIFPSIVQHRDLIARLTEGPSNNYQFGLDSFFDDPDDFVLDGDASDRKPCSYDTTDHMFSNIWFLIDMATDELAKEIKNIPTANTLGQSYEKAARRYLLNNAIEERVRLFILDELPKTLVEYLAHNVEHVVDIFQLELQLMYQVMFLLTDHKAGVGGDSFMMHYNYDVYTDGPILDFEDYTYDQHIDFFFPLADMLCPDRDWLNDNHGINMEAAKDSDLYFVKKCYEVCTKNSTEPVLTGEWRYLSIEGGEVNKAAINQYVLNTAVLSLYELGDLRSVTLAKDIVNKGAVSDSWKGTYYPPIKFED
ncbi:hypothetical protein IOT39_004002 [Escherichia coli]|nr:hypothetical protein [Escherichia coli]